MRNTAINNLTYTGIVTLSRYVGSKKIKIAQLHNTGGNPLFDFLADCLIGDFVTAKVFRPTKIMLLNRIEVSDEPGTYEYDSKSGFIYLLTKPEKIDSATQSKVRYSFIIPKDQIEGVDTTTGLGIGLYTDSTTLDDINNYAAFYHQKMIRKY